jgi:hypothetical protein
MKNCHETRDPRNEALEAHRSQAQRCVSARRLRRPCDLGGYDQVGRALRQLVREGRLVKVGQGLYARARPSMTSGEPVPVGGLSTLKEALRRVGAEALPSRLEQAYNAGRTTQAPTGRVVGVNRRVRGKIGYGGFTLSFERVGPAAGEI